MAAAPDLGSGAERRGGSSPFTRTTNKKVLTNGKDFFYSLCKLYLFRGLSLSPVLKELNQAIKIAFCWSDNFAVLCIKV